ncbi:MAG: hypothetical protein IKT38_02415 [Clostridia bacterium]|nr:hypothetical protein [Clostridia bacterium]
MKILLIIKDFIITHKIVTSVVASVLALTIGTTSAVIVINTNKNENKDDTSSKTSSVSSVVSEVESEEESEPEESSEPVSSEQKPATSKPVTSKPAVPATTPSNNSYSYSTNTDMDIDNNVFMDSLIYTGYNINKHRSDGLMWQYVLASQKRGKGWLSKISYAGGSTGYETANGKPNIAHFERGGLVCASYVTYVYFNYLPNVAGIDTSSLTRPADPKLANSWYIAAQDWVKKGYSKYIDFTYNVTGSGFINFKAKESIPIGSIICMSDARRPGSTACSHVSIYAGYKNGYNWVYHVGNENGPEFCAIERMHFGPDPQLPLKVITTPANIRMSALLEISVTDDSGKPMSNVKLSLKNTKSGKIKDLGSTNASGKVTVSNLIYGSYTLTQTTPTGYTCSAPSQNITLTAKNNSYNKYSFKNTKIVVEESKPESESEITSETPLTE